MNNKKKEPCQILNKWNEILKLHRYISIFSFVSSLYYVGYILRKESLYESIDFSEKNRKYSRLRGPKKNYSLSIVWETLPV